MTPTANDITSSELSPEEKLLATTTRNLFERFVIVGSWLLLTSALLFFGHRHAAWFDEAQAWLIARDNSLFDTLFRRMHYEGSPALWHVLLWILVRLRFPYASITYLSVAFASLGAGIFLRYAPFPLALRVLFVFGYFPAFQYAVVARSYSLSLPLVILAATLFPNRMAKPLRYCTMLAALASTNAYSFLFASVVFCEFLGMVLRFHARSRRCYLAILIFLGAAVAAVTQALPAKDVRLSEPWLSLGIASRLAIQVLVSFVQFHTPHNLVGGVLILLQLLLSVGALVFTFQLARRAKHENLMLAIFVVLIFFGTFKYFSIWNAGLIYLAWTFIVWISWPSMIKVERDKRLAIFVLVALIFSVQLYGTLAAWGLSVSTPYSAAPLAAARLHEYLDRNPDLRVGCLGLKALAVQPYFSHNVCANYYGGNAKPSYYDWKQGQPYSPLPDVRVLDNLMRSETFDLFLVSNMSISPDQADDVAHAQGYCLSDRLPGRLIWKDDFYENDGLNIFRKCAER